MAWVVTATPLTIPCMMLHVLSSWRVNRTLSVPLILLVWWMLSVPLMVTDHFIHVLCIQGVMLLVPCTLCILRMVYVPCVLHRSGMLYVPRVLHMSCMLYVPCFLCVVYAVHAVCVLCAICAMYAACTDMLPDCGMLHVPLMGHVPHMNLVLRALFVPCMVTVHPMLHVHF
jgi:hypothetical protein